MKHAFPLVFIIFFGFFISCQKKEAKTVRVRGVVDRVGFATRAGQMDSILSRIRKDQRELFQQAEQRQPAQPWKIAISPHDDYTYVGYLYPALFSGIKAETVIIFGVAHKAKKLGLENKIIFDTYPYWHGIDHPLKISSLREELIAQLDTGLYEVNDSMQTIEHSVEALVPFLQYFNPKVQIVSILVPYMSYDRMQEIAKPLARAIRAVTQKRGWQWGKDFSLLISNDAVHYGDRDWGGKNFARYGSDRKGYNQAVAFEHRLIDSCLNGPLTLTKIKAFTRHTVQANDFRAYKWTWCGRYSVPLGLSVAFYLQKMQSANRPLQGTLLGYATSIDHPHLKVDDLGMGVTAPANLHHWVGYAALCYR